MAGWRVEFSSAAARQFRKLPGPLQLRILPHIESLAYEPRPNGAKKLVADEELWRIRVGLYRVVYAIRDSVLVVLVVKVGHRRDVYRTW